jgi:hypothetical protein
MAGLESAPFELYEVVHLLANAARIGAGLLSHLRGSGFGEWRPNVESITIFLGGAGGDAPT